MSKYLNTLYNKPFNSSIFLMSNISCQPGELIECSDPAIREYILDLNRRNRTQGESKGFVLRDIPPNHLFIKKGYSEELRKAINTLIDDNTFKEEGK